MKVANCEVRFIEVKNLRNILKVTTLVIAPTRAYEVVYYLDTVTREVLYTDPYTLHREMRDIHSEWREMGVMTKVMVPLNWYQRLMGFNPEASYRRFFNVDIWEGE